MAATLFDFNGVLVDDEHVHLDAFRAVLLPLQIDLPEKLYNERYIGFDDVGAFEAILRDHGRAAEKADIMRLVEAKKPAYMAKIMSALRIFPGASELVRRRAALGPVGIVSGALEHEIEYCLAQMGVRKQVHFIVSAERTERCKPDPEGYILALRMLNEGGAPVKDAVVIEDSLAGVQAAKGAGLRCAAVAHSFSRDDLAKAGADVVFDTIASVTDRELDGGV